ncbi:deiodinase-like protein [Thalassospira alkalitolerans]|uniref:deiodinase-like protein n=1 Tax=Thalassospira alkalitolerans TaxID=1293890 RepID=UPI003AA919B1
MQPYNYDGFSTGGYDFENITGPKTGEKAPDIRLATSDGEVKNLLRFKGEFLVLEMGSMTCPLFQSRRTIMQPLELEFSNVSSAVLYVREAHPGVKIPGHKSYGDKVDCARRLATEGGETRTIFIDDFEGSAHQAYGGMPNAVFIINKSGCVVFRSEWNNPSATRKALKELTAGRPVTAKSYFRPALPTTVFKTLINAGDGAAADFFKGLPFLIWVNIIKRNIRILLNRPVSTANRNDC